MKINMGCGLPSLILDQASLLSRLHPWEQHLFTSSCDLHSRRPFDKQCWLASSQVTFTSLSPEWQTSSTRELLNFLEHSVPSIEQQEVFAPLRFAAINPGEPSKKLSPAPEQPSNA